MEVLGKEFEGLLGCDYFSAYRKYMKDFGVLVQFCLAHFIRDVKFLAEHPDPRNRAYGQRLLCGSAAAVRDHPSPRTVCLGDHLPSGVGAGRDDIGVEMPRWNRRILARRWQPGRSFLPAYDSYFRFITEPSVEPTNNLAEQALRFVAIHRRITQGTRSEDGRRWCERIWTAIQTCGQQDRSVFEFLCAAVTAYFRSELAPSLAPDTS